MLKALNETANCQVARLSGSGATCFGIFLTAEAALSAMTALKQQYPRWWIAPATLLK